MAKIKKVTSEVHVGFTLIELLVVFGILSTILSLVITAVNPIEQNKRALDVSTRAVAEDFISANVQFLTSEKVLPWQKNSDCLNEIERGGILAEMPNCLQELTDGGALGAKYSQSPEVREIHVNKCGDSAVLCYSPKSKIEYKDAKYDKFGVNKPGCPGTNGGTSECYWCKPINGNPSCNNNTTPTPDNTPTVTPSPTITYSQLVPGYANDETKFFKTYAVYFFDYPGFPPPAGGWSMHISTRSDFGGDYTETYRSFGIPSWHSQGAPLNASYEALRKITSKYLVFVLNAPSQ